MSLRDQLERRHVPRLLVALSTVDAHHRAAAAVGRRRGQRGRVELFVAFDDPYGVVAALGLRDRLRGREVDLDVQPVVQRGIPDDPAVDAKRAYAVTDSARLLARDGRTLTRTAPLERDAVAHLAAWAHALPDVASRTAFSVEALEDLWCRQGTGDPVDAAALRAIHDLHAPAGHAPPASHPGVAAAEQRLAGRVLYDTPAALVHGHRFFAHERLDQIADRLDALGFPARQERA